MRPVSATGGTAMESNASFRHEIEHLPDDEHGNKVTVVKRHGRLISENSAEVKELVKPLLAAGGRIVIDPRRFELCGQFGSGNPDRPEGLRRQTGLVHIGIREHDTPHPRAAADFQSLESPVDISALFTIAVYR